MTSISSFSSQITDPNHGIIYPQGELWSDEPPLESNLHIRQILILIQSLEWLWQDRDDYFASGNLTIYYSPNQKKSEFFRGPDFFVVLGTTRNPERKSWVVWEEEGKYPNVIVEILSDSTAKTDREEKKQIYQDIFQTPNYFWFDPYTLEFAGFTLINEQYQPIDPNEQGWLWSKELGLYLGIYEKELRYFTSDGELVKRLEESLIQEQQLKELALQREALALQQKEEERQKKELALQQKEEERQQKELVQNRLAAINARLKELGIELDD
ncbi:MAG: Uma2 family endonuclease [Microcystaceae cyanobacterium]